MKLILLFFIFLLTIPLAFGDTFEPNRYLYHETLNLSETNPLVEFYVVKHASDMPCPRTGPGILVGCAYYSPIEGTISYIYIIPEFYLDEFGMTPLAHEILHIECKCDWHTTQESINLVKKYGKYPYRFILQNSHAFQAHEILNRSGS